MANFSGNTGKKKKFVSSQKSIFVKTVQKGEDKEGKEKK